MNPSRVLVGLVGAVVVLVVALGALLIFQQLTSRDRVVGRNLRRVLAGAENDKAFLAVGPGTTEAGTAADLVVVYAAELSDSAMAIGVDVRCEQDGREIRSRFRSLPGEGPYMLRAFDRENLLGSSSHCETLLLRVVVNAGVTEEDGSFVVTLGENETEVIRTELDLGALRALGEPEATRRQDG